MSLDQINLEPDDVFHQLYSKYSLHIYYLNLKQYNQGYIPSFNTIVLCLHMLTVLRHYCYHC